MALSDDDRKRLHDEEIYRAEVRKSLEGAKAPPGFGQRFSGFLESKVGFWILTTVFAGLYATLFTNFSNWLHRDEIADRQHAERARQDFDTVIKVVPMLTSENAGNRQVGLSLLNGLASAKSIQPEIAEQITSTLQSIVLAGAAPNASPEARARANEVARLVDAGTTGSSTAPGPAATPVPDQPTPATANAPNRIGPAISAVALPPRVYVQIGAEGRRDDANKAVEAMRSAGVLAPGIEKVARVPAKNELRYCSQKMFDASKDAVLRALGAVAIEVVPTPLPASLCGNVRPNQFELWLGSGAG